MGGLYHGWGGGGEGGISHPRLCAGAGERRGGPGEDSLQYFSSKLENYLRRNNGPTGIGEFIQWTNRYQGGQPSNMVANPNKYQIYFHLNRVCVFYSPQKRSKSTWQQPQGKLGKQLTVLSWQQLQQLSLKNQILRHIDPIDLKGTVQRDGSSRN